MPSPIGDAILFDDFVGYTVLAAACSESPWEVTAMTSNTVLTVPCEPGGILRLLTDNTDNDVAMVAAGTFRTRVQDGAVDALFRIKVNTATNLGISLGLTDANTESNLMPWDDSGGTLTTTASTGIGFVFDTGGNTKWDTVYVDDDSDGSQVSSCEVVTAATYQTFRIRLEDNGSGNQVRAEFSIDCNKYYEVRTATIDRDALLTPFVAVQNQGTTAHNLDIDYIYVSQSRASDS